ncbi:bifunctional DNA-formamidopyrimidine glycosylase/DNA-(apurinic or apyrimidinic site) lyase [Roseiflexus sp.]|uniref:bifunctional DNA-formamidopyrimidine glycosylase/DNA-(apurinic or apyrimidinic site) lyase n=1 Tax=Roseiflexus TaxID=120961 RepID=UPI0021DEEC91|nr:bifunctional DNA-formamidopyrimidine glycosylase/DNA-(apurinic or apyrimidinic site) lyase [Roseiflexus sp.]GIW03341.1 MAG: formamidopyrimidine-DNA glycosylase [Roseiflexus sp.]
MPELPEVQHTADSLGIQIAGARIARVERLDWTRMVETPSPDEFIRLLTGRQVRGWDRRAKWILLFLDDGWTLALHLRMSGSLTVHPAEAQPDKHTHLALRLEDGRQIFFHDPRKFGRARLLDSAGLAALDAAHGDEPLSDAFTVERLASLLRNRKRAIKPLLLDQSVIAGIGNIYADEALWRARIHPLRPAADLSAAEVAALHDGIRAALRQALANGGSTLRDYRNSYGAGGTNQEHFNAYDREGRPCPRCGATIIKTVVAQRGTHYCPACQAIPSATTNRRE